MSIKAIGFDYGGVIAGLRAAGSNFKDDVCALAGIDSATFDQAYFSINHLINLGAVADWRQFWQLFLSKVGDHDKLDALIALSNAANERLDEIDGGMVRLVDTLRANGYETGLLSNTSLDGAVKQRASGLPEHFDVYLLSAEIKLMKPDLRAFALLAEKLQVQPSEMIFVDDTPKSLSTAADCGFIPILFESRDKLIAQLQDLGVSF